MVAFAQNALTALTVALSLTSVSALPRRVTTAASLNSLSSREPEARRITNGATIASSGLSTRARKNKTANKAATGTNTSTAAAAVTTATDGSIILDSTATVNGLTLRFKVSAPPDRFTTAANGTGGTATPGSNSDLGINVLLHGDGGQSFFDFPNQGVNDNLAGIALLAPNSDMFWGGGSGLDRTDGVAHAQLVRDFVLSTLPNILSFDPGNVFFTGVSGGSLLLSGFFIPAHMVEFPNGGALLECGAMEPQVSFNKTVDFIGNTRIHWQSTQNELELLQESIPASIAAYAKVGLAAGMPNALLEALQTANNEPVGGHCEFDSKDFVTGVQLMSDSYSAIMQGGNGTVSGIGNVLQSSTNATLTFGAAA